MTTLALEIADIRAAIANVKNGVAAINAQVAKFRHRPITLVGSITIRAAADQPLPPAAAAMLRRHGLTASAAVSLPELSEILRNAGVKPEERMVAMRALERHQLNLPQ